MKLHHRLLEKMYLRAPVQGMYPGITIVVSDQKAEISLPVRPDYFHAGGSVHGSVYFRLLDDAAYFAASSVIDDYFLLTTTFHIEMIRPISSGVLAARGSLIHRGAKLLKATSELFDDKNRLVALGKGTFMRSNTPFNAIESYEKTE